VVALAVALGGCSNSPSAVSTSTTTTTQTAGATTTTAPTTATTAPTTAAGKLYAKVLANVSRASSVQYVATSSGTQSGATTELHFTADVSASGGKQTATWSGGGTKGTFTIIVTGSGTYLNADAASLATFFGAMPPANSSTYAGQWISFTSTDKLYKSLHSDITLAAVASSLRFDPSSDHAISGGAVVITGQPLSSSTTPAGEKASTTMTVSSQSGLPEEQSFSASDNGATETSSISFSDWNKAVTATAPSGSITWASVALAITPTTTAAG
jgi:hypothetical protein